MGYYWNTLNYNHYYAQMSQCYLVNQQWEPESRDQQFYRRMKRNFEDCYRSPEKNKLYQGW